MMLGRMTLRLRWKILIALAALVAGALAWLLVPRRVQREQLLEAAWAEERATDFRASHVSAPLPGTFGELLEPYLPALHESRAAYERLGAAGMDRVKRVCGGQDSIAQMGPEISADLALHRPAMRGALRATHAKFARAPASLRLFGYFGPGEPFLDVKQAAWLAALDVLDLLEQGRTGEAIDECADALALGRDVSYPSVMGRMFGVGVTAFSAYACGQALSAAPAAAVDRARARLVAIRRGTPRFAEILRREWLFQQLWLADSDSGLPDGARVFIAGMRNQHRSAFARLELALFGPTAWEGQAARMAAFVEAQGLGWPDCADRMEEVTARFHWNPMVRESSGFVGLLRRHRDGLLKLDALACAASVLMERARTGTFPRDADSSCPPIEPQATCGEQSAPIRIVDDRGGSGVSVRLSGGSEYTVRLAREVRGSAAVLR
jgi:hypothetical protein